MRQVRGPVLKSDENARQAAELIAAGYARTSWRYRMVSRIDRIDWREHVGLTIRKGGEKGPGVTEAMAADSYRRCVSRDTLEGIPSGVFKLIPLSDTAGYGFRAKTPAESDAIFAAEIERTAMRMVERAPAAPGNFLSGWWGGFRREHAQFDNAEDRERFMRLTMAHAHEIIRAGDVPCPTTIAAESVYTRQEETPK